MKSYIKNQIKLTIFIIFILLMILLLVNSCKKEEINNQLNLIFTSDSLNVFGKLNGIYLYSNQIYKVNKNNIIKFIRISNNNPNIFNIRIDVGYYNGFNDLNKHYLLTNEYVLIIK